MKKLRIFYVIVLLLVLSACSEKVDILFFPKDNIEIEVGEFYDLAPTSNCLVNFEIKDESIISINSTVIKGLKVGATEIIATAGARKATLIVTVVEETLDDPTEPSAPGIPEEPTIPDDPIPLANTMSVYFIDVGQGDCIFVELPNGENLMIDAGEDHAGEVSSWANITSTLDALGVSIIDHLIITHNHSDHYAYVPNIISKYDVLNVYGSGSTRTNTQYLSVMNSISNAGLDYNVVSVGDKIIDVDGLMLQVVATRQIFNETDPNITSVVTRLVFGNVAFMFTGDAGYTKPTDGEYTALNSGFELKADVLKVGHHGSSGSSSNQFLEAVGATYGVLTTATITSTGHPKADALARLEAHNMTLYQTKDHGNIIFRTTSNRITKIETSR